ncbi:MAG: glutamyl-tRNA reductase [Bacteroidota bacterium]
MLDGFHVLTLTFRDAPLDAIGNAIIPEADSAKLQDLKNTFNWQELMYLATCNRVMYLFYTQKPVQEDLPLEMLRAFRPDLMTEVQETAAAQMRMLHGANAVQHLFEVASSMDSLVVGEREIIRQLREAYDKSYAWGITGDHLRLLVRFTIETAKEVYTQTGIGEKALSVVALAFSAMTKTGLKQDARILMVGAGETNQLFAKFLVKYGYHNVTVFNRTYQNAVSLAENIGGQALPFDALHTYVAGFDALIVCTAATDAIIDPACYERLLAGETDSKVVVDLSIPHNIDKRIPTGFPVQYIEIEGLRSVAQENLAHRTRACAKAEVLIRQRIYGFRELWHERQVERALSHIPEEVHAVKQKAIEQVFSKEFAQLDAQAQQTVLQMLDYMEKKCIAIPMKAAKAVALNMKKQRETAKA